MKCPSSHSKSAQPLAVLSPPPPPHLRATRATGIFSPGGSDPRQHRNLQVEVSLASAAAAVRGKRELALRPLSCVGLTPT